MANSLNVECEYCLSRELSDEQYIRTIKEYVNLVPLDKRADSRVYQRRLKLCSACEFLQNGMCRMCGCFVEIRAIVAKRTCPINKPEW